jgi:hypothetical protein
LLASLPLRQPDREFFEAAKASRWLGQMLLPACGGIRKSPLAAGQVAAEGADVVWAFELHAIPLSGVSGAERAAR